jgi:hypothetical protein
MRSDMSRGAACVVLALCALSARAAADTAAVRRSSVESRGRLHAYAGLFGSTQLVAAQSTDYRRGYLDHGGGGGLFAGVRLNRLFSVEGNWRVTVNGEHLSAARVTNLPVDALIVTTWGVGARVHWPTGGIVEPYGHASAGYAAIMVSYVDCPDCPRVFATGPAAELGGGIDVHLGRRASVGLRLTGQLLHFGQDAFEKRFRQVGFEPSSTQATILSSATDLYAMFHF